MKKILAIDIGNTCTSFAYFKNNKMILRENVLTNKLESFIKNYKVKNGYKVVISSVVPEVNKFFTKLNAKIITHKDFDVISGSIDNPSEVGTDLLCKVVTLENKKVIVISFGTATTILFVNPRLVGVSILPGMKMQLSALSSGTSQLHYTQAKKVKDILGKNTTDAILSGVILSQAYSVNSFVTNIKKQYSEDIKVIITGGYAEYITKYLDFKYKIKSNMVLEGINKIA